MAGGHEKTALAGSPAELALRRLFDGDDTPASRRQGAEITRFLHTIGLEAGTYTRLLEARGSGAAESTAFDFVEQHLEQIKPRDPLERMLAIQILWQHVRISSLCVREARTSDPKELSAIRTAIEQAMNTFRRQVQALRDLQIPRPVNVIRGGQVNVSNNQVVTNNQLNARVSPANELRLANGSEEAVRVER